MLRWRYPWSCQMPVLSTKPDNRPAVDEWGIYDPEQAGLSAVRERIEAKRKTVAEPTSFAMAASMRDANELTKKPTR